MISNPLIVMALVTILLLAGFAGFELLVRRRGASSEVTRRIIHVIAAAYGIFVFVEVPRWGFFATCAAFAIALTLSARYGILTSIHNTRRRSFGEVYLPLGLAGAGLIARDDTRIYVAAVLIMGLADVGAGITGDVMRATSKTWAGSVVFLVVAAVVLVACGYPAVIVATVALATAVVERSSFLGADNLTVPIVAAGLLLVL